MDSSPKEADTSQTNQAKTSLSAMKVDSSQEAKVYDDETDHHRSKISSESEREKTKLRERKRRSITSKILYGLRKHGNYDLPPRADINDVLRALANEAGWEVEHDGTTYRKSKQQQASDSHCWAPLQQISPVAGPSLIQSGGSSSFVGSFPANMGGFNCVLSPIVTDPIDLRGGDCSTTASPRHMARSSISLLQTNSTFSSPFTSPASSEVVPCVQVANPFVMTEIPSGFMPIDSFGLKDNLPASFLPADAIGPRDWTAGRTLMGTPTSSFIGNSLQSGNLHYNTRMTTPSIMTLPQYNPFLQESRASNQNTPIGSPQPHGGNG